MPQIFALQNEKNWKTLLLDETVLKLVNERYKTEEEFMEKYEEKGFLKKRLEISLLDIESISHPEQAGNNATITYADKSGSTTLELQFSSVDEKDVFVNLVKKPRNLIASTGGMPWYKAIVPAGIGLLITLFFGFITYIDAQTIESGGEVDTGGRRSLYKKLFAWLGETLGTSGTLITAGIISLICLYFIYKNLKNPPRLVIYS